ncbi:MAG: polysaccharide deacetylase family protein [Bacillota bacterium]
MSPATIITEINTNHKAIAFTFDDGPNPLFTPQVLEIFQEVSGRATFFMIGKHMLNHPEIVSQVTEQMHEIGNHTFSHPRLTELSSTESAEEIIRTDKIIMELTGTEPKTFRPPFIDYNDETVSLLKKLDYHMISAVNFEATDWEMPGVAHIVSKTRDQVRNGSILLFHDGFGDRSQTIEAVRLLATELTSQGYRLVTVSELLSLKNQ